MPLIATTQSTVSDLLRNFAEACRALVPSLDRASVRWAGEMASTYDNWDRVAEALSESLVLEPCRFHVAAVFPSAVLKLERYGFMPAGANAFVSLNRNRRGRPLLCSTHLARKPIRRVRRLVRR